MTNEESSELELSASRRLPYASDRVWAMCTTKVGLERWWSAEDLQTKVRKLEVRTDGEVDIHVRYVPALLTANGADVFRAAGVPIAFDLRGKLTDVVPERTLTFDLALDIGDAGARVGLVTKIELVPEGDSTRVSLIGRGPGTSHWIALGQQNLEAQLERLARALDH